MLKIGEIFDKKYTITREIGKGGMASVFEGQNIRLKGKKVAIKVLNPELTARPDIKQRFENEAKIMCQLRNQYVISADDFIEDNSFMAIVMEYVEGTPLNECIPQTGLTEVEANNIFLKILEGFEYIHKQGIVHRDIKPSNVMLLENSIPKILDFGIAKITGQNEITENNANTTQTGAFMGTISYMSPEQIKDTKNIDHRSDIYALGVMYYVLLLGNKPYNENTTSQFEIQTNIVSKPLPNLDKFPPHIQAILAKATEKDTKDRFQSCQEFIDAIKNPDQITKLQPKTENNLQDQTQVDTKPQPNNNNTQKNPPIQDKTIDAKPQKNKEKKTAIPIWLFGVFGFMGIVGIAGAFFFSNTSSTSKNNTTDTNIAQIDKDEKDKKVDSDTSKKVNPTNITEQKEEKKEEKNKITDGTSTTIQNRTTNGNITPNLNNTGTITPPSTPPTSKFVITDFLPMITTDADYTSDEIKNIVGGFHDVFAKITNHSPYIIDNAIVRIKIFLRNGKLHQTNDVSFVNVASGQTQKMPSKDSGRGTKLRAELRYIKIGNQQWSNPNP